MGDHKLKALHGNCFWLCMGTCQKKQREVVGALFDDCAPRYLDDTFSA